MRFPRVLAVAVAMVLLLTAIGGIPVQKTKALTGDLPGWEVGDFWEYTMWAKRVTPNGTVTLSNGFYKLFIDSKTATQVIVKVTGTGQFDFPPISGDFSQSDTYSYSINDLSLMGVTYSTHFTKKSGTGNIDDWNTMITYSPPVFKLQWPLHTGQTWSSPTTATINSNKTKAQTWSFSIGAIVENRPDKNSKVHETFNITSTVNTSGGKQFIYYAPDAGAVVFNATFDSLNERVEYHQLGRYKFSGQEFPWLWIGIAVTLVVVFVLLTVIYFVLKKRKAKKEEMGKLSPMSAPSPGEFQRAGPPDELFGAEGSMGPRGPGPQYGPPPGAPGPQPQYTPSGFLAAPPPGAQPQSGYAQPQPSQYPQPPPTQPQPPPGYPQPAPAQQPYGYAPQPAPVPQPQPQTQVYHPPPQAPPQQAPQPAPQYQPAPQAPPPGPQPQPHPQVPPPYGYPQQAQPQAPPQQPQPQYQAQPQPGYPQPAQPQPAQMPQQPQPAQPAGIVPCSRCGAPMPSHQPYCPRCGAPRSG